jgi:hypothetical protein
MVHKSQSKDVMERRHFLNFTVGLIAGAAALAVSAQAAPLPPVQHAGQSSQGAEPAIVSQDEVNALKPEQVRWGHHGHGHHWGWHHRRHWGWHHRHWGWRHRHWGWRHHHWHHRHWHHRHW